MGSSGAGLVQLAGTAIGSEIGGPVGGTIGGIIGARIGSERFAERTCATSDAPPPVLPVESQEASST
jgi:uncharacterized membrane protein